MWKVRTTIHIWNSLQHGFHEAYFHEIKVIEHNFMDNFRKELYPNRTNTEENTGKFSFKPFSKTWLPLYRFSQNPHLITGVM
jgi:hypothetical protein